MNDYEKKDREILGMSSRRDLLKLFTAGAVITPLAGGAQAKLITTPKVELIKPETGIIAPFCPDDVVGADVAFRMKDGSVRRFQPDHTSLGFNSAERLPIGDARRYISDAHVRVDILHERTGSPTYLQILASVDMRGRFRNRNAVVELP